MTALGLVTGIGAALVAGIFFAFSTFVMGALGRLRPSEGIAAMQSINVVVLNPWFFSMFFGTGVVAIAAVGLALVSAPGLVSQIAIGAGLYVVGCLGVTIAGNVPLNNRLAAVDPEAESSRALWGLYLSRWTLLNHVRTAASLASAVVILLALHNT